MKEMRVNKRHALIVNVNIQMLDNIDRLAAAWRVSRAHVVREAVREFIRQQKEKELEANLENE